MCGFYLGQPVLITLTDAELNQIESKRLLYSNTSDAEYHQGSPVVAAQSVVAIITRVFWADATSGHVLRYGLRVLLDGTDDLWIPDVPPTRIVSAEPPAALPDPSAETERLWPAIRMKVKQLLQSGTSVTTHIYVTD